MPYRQLGSLFDSIELLNKLDSLDSLLFLGMQSIDLAKSFD